MLLKVVFETRDGRPPRHGSDGGGLEAIGNDHLLQEDVEVVHEDICHLVSRLTEHVVRYDVWSCSFVEVYH